VEADAFAGALKQPAKLGIVPWALLNPSGSFPAMLYRDPTPPERYMNKRGMARARLSRAELFWNTQTRSLNPPGLIESGEFGHDAKKTGLARKSHSHFDGRAILLYDFFARGSACPASFYVQHDKRQHGLLILYRE
jgi:hypothetical protein